MNQLKLFDTVALLENLPRERLALVEAEIEEIESLPSGLVGTIAHVFYQDDKEYYLIEFSDSQGHEYVTATLSANEFLILHQELQISR